MIKLYETEKFHVRPFVQSDITDAYLAWFHDQEVARHTSYGLFPYTRDHALRFLEGAERAGDLIWGIFVKKEKETLLSTEVLEYRKAIGKKIPPSYIHIGNVALQNINWVDRTAEFAGIIGEKDYWNKGIGTEAARLLFKHGFSKLNLNKIWLGTAASNLGMISVAGKLGMTIEGRLKDHVFLNGRYEGVIRFGILKSGWDEKNKI